MRLSVGLALALVLITFLVSGVSASSVRVEPQTFDLRALAGETVTQNISIFTPEESVVYLEVAFSENTSELDVVPNFSSVVAVPRNTTVPVSFSLGTGSIPQSFRVTVRASLNVPDPEAVPAPSGGGGGRVGGTYRVNRTAEPDLCSYTYQKSGLTVKIPCSQIPAIEIEEAALTERERWEQFCQIHQELFICNNTIVNWSEGGNAGTPEPGAGMPQGSDSGHGDEGSSKWGASPLVSGKGIAGIAGIVFLGVVLRKLLGASVGGAKPVA